jgi:GNAT superfamily N-acetyltransferase
MVDTLALGASGGNPVKVQVLSSAPRYYPLAEAGSGYNGSVINLRTAKPADAAALSDIAFQSKAHWGYSDDFMAACKEELIVAPEACASGLVVVGEENGILMGFYRLGGKPPIGELNDLFIAPMCIGTGAGKTLFQAARDHAIKLGFEALRIHSDLHAEALYLHMGAKKIGSSPSGSILGRELPILQIDLLTLINHPDKGGK